MPFGFSMEIPYTEEQWKLKLRRQARKGEAGVTQPRLKTMFMGFQTTHSHCFVFQNYPYQLWLTHGSVNVDTLEIYSVIPIASISYYVSIEPAARISHHVSLNVQVSSSPTVQSQCDYKIPYDTKLHYRSQEIAERYSVSSGSPCTSIR